MNVMDDTKIRFNSVWLIESWYLSLLRFLQILIFLY